MFTVQKNLFKLRHNKGRKKPATLSIQNTNRHYNMLHDKHSRELSCVSCCCSVTFTLLIAVFAVMNETQTLI